MRTQHGAADSDMENARKRTESAGLDRIDQRSHSLTARCGQVDLLWRAASPLGDVGRRTSLARIDDPAGEERFARRSKAALFRSLEKVVDDCTIKMSLRPVEIDSGDLERIKAEAVRLGLEELLEGLCRLRLLSFGHAAAHNAAWGKCHPALTSRHCSPNREANERLSVPPR